MNAKITLTVPMDKIPREVTRLLDDINIELNEIVYETSELIKSEDLLNKIKAITELRKRLNAVDLTYDDCYTILVGYVKYLNDSNIKNTLETENKDGNQSNG
jgi:hypothetical protein